VRHREVSGNDVPRGDIDHAAIAGARLAPGARRVGAAGGRDEARQTPPSIASPLRWQRSSARSAVTNGGCQTGQKLVRSSTVARQKKSVLTNTGRPDGSTPTSCAKTSPVYQATCGT
jgi:hypothetical protein